MTLTNLPVVPLGNTDRFFIGGEWIKSSSDATIDVIDSGTEKLFFCVPEAREADMSQAVDAARKAFDEGPWPRMSHAERAGFVRARGGSAGAKRGRRADLAPGVRRRARLRGDAHGRLG
jgi:aldehyde dehydrogenase (NAD+)